MIIGHAKFYKVWKNTISLRFKRRRFRLMMDSINCPAGRRLKILEVGCANGKDVLQFLDDPQKYELWGLDIKPQHIAQENVTFVQGNATDLPFSDGFFDIVITVGLLEHIEPMETLSQVISELNRVGRHQLSVVPSVSTLLEPHSGKWRLPLRLQKNRIAACGELSILRLNFFSEHTWTKFSGFSDCKVKRFYYLFPLVRNTLIYR